jgi:hypothetical protein
LGRGLASAKLCGECGRFGNVGLELRIGSKTSPRAPGEELIFDTRTSAGSGAKSELGSNFHFSDLPTVTAGFIVFSFDIRKYFK